MKNILTNSLLAAATFIAVYFVFYFIDPSLNFKYSLILPIGIVIYLFFLIRAGIRKRKNLGGFISFGEVFVSSIAIYAIASFTAMVFTLIMLNIDPELMELMKESSSRTSESMFRMAGMSEEQIALATEEANENMDLVKSSMLSNMFVGWLISIIIPGLIYALIASLIVKKKDKSIV
ncbi:DUF4199 domain-containing protein [Aureibaculum conchae]|uniref:DUF4199 domain-containing protein n=1 Tax=Aureibaculum sp. 2308TA14-22 TaxID=3108392 RepID=UPI003392E1BF